MHDNDELLAVNVEVAQPTTATDSQLSVPGAAVAANTVFTWLEHNYNEPTGSGLSETSADADVPVVSQTSVAFQSDKTVDSIANVSGQTIPESADSQLMSTLLNRILDCSCQLERDFLKNYPRVKLKCSVCSTPFGSLSKLADHKHSSSVCMNQVLMEPESTEAILSSDKAQNHQQIELFIVQIEDQELDERFLESHNQTRRNQKRSETKKNKSSRSNQCRVEVNQSKEDEDIISLIKEPVNKRSTQGAVKNSNKRNRTDEDVNEQETSPNLVVLEMVTKPGELNQEHQAESVEKAPRLRRKYEKRKKFSDSNLNCPSKSPSLIKITRK